jgi:phage terminase large subunit-like protein
MSTKVVMARSDANQGLHQATRYARDVVDGRIVAGRLVKFACARHLRDLAEGAARGLYFDMAAAQHAIDFFGFLRHSKGRQFAGKPFVLEPWQQFILGSLFGWKKADGYRRFRSAQIEIARKNGKTTLFAGVGLYLFFADGEPGAEVYCVATKKDQAKILFGEAERMRGASPGLKRKIASFRNNMNIPGTASKFEPLGSDADTTDGLNVHGALSDEFHEQKSRELWDKLDTATGSRLQPLLAAITTAGDDRETVCWKQHEYAERVLQQINEDDTFFAYIAAIDDEDDPFDESCWPKGNPNLGVSVRVEDLRERAARARQDPSSLNAFLRYRLNRWTSSETAAISPDAWRACAGFSLAGKNASSLRAEIEQQLEGRECVIAVDLASTEDIACAGKLFPPEDEEQPYIFLPRFYVPEDRLEEKIREWRQPYDVWHREGFLIATDGNVIDYDVILADVMTDIDRYQVREITFDPWNATQFSNDLQKAGVPADKLVKFPQTVPMFAEPTKRLLEVLIPNRKIAHLANPPLAWMAANLTVKEDTNGNKRPVKRTGRGKIDGMVSLIMGLGRLISSVEQTGVYSGPDEVTFV